MNRENFAKLADFLETVPDNAFDMSDFSNLAGYEEKSYLKTGQHPCGTVCCAAGWGPAAGIPNTHPDGYWVDYVKTNFVGNDCGVSANPVYQWAFSCAWAYCDNTRMGAVKRIRYMLEHGVPAEFIDNDSHPHPKFVPLYDGETA